MEDKCASPQPGGTLDATQCSILRNLVAVGRSLCTQAKAPRIPLADVCDEAEQALAGSCELAAIITRLTESIEQQLERHRQFDWQIHPDQRPIGEGIPETMVDGWLPPGMWKTTWQQLVCRYAYSTHRKRLMRGLLIALHMLAKAGCTKVMIGGSFVSTKFAPQDIDMCWFEDGMDNALLDPVLAEDSLITRQTKLGIDAYAAEDWKKKLLSNQCLSYEDELDYSQFEPLPMARAVGVLLIDPSESLPEPDAFYQESSPEFDK